jgi:putative iron-only hydrogenase system regulator
MYRVKYPIQKECPMERRLGIVAVVIEDEESIPRVNATIHESASIVDGRLGLPMRDRGIALISLVVNGSTDDIGALTGRLGRLRGVKVKSVLTGFREDEGDDDRDEGLHRKPEIV